ncbi:MAG: ABC transporter permease [Clostridia bacterium]|nr:ABC transporter permease [Clostridia bacterium]
MSSDQIAGLLIQGLWETLYMTLVSTAFAYLIGLPVGVILVTTGKHGIRPNPVLHHTIGVIVNILRSVPFLILMIALIPFTRFVIGTTLGSTATIVPLVVASAPFVARMVESSLQEVDPGVVEAALSMGASTWQVIWKVLLAEARPALLMGSTIAVTTILSYSAMAGILGGGGLGDIASRYGFYRYQYDIMLLTIIVLVLVVQVLQEAGSRAARAVDKRQ